MSKRNRNRNENITTRGLSGLTNLGNTCYMNSVIQVLSNTDIILAYIKSDDFDKDLNNVIIEENNKKYKTEKISNDDMYANKKNTLSYRLYRVINHMWNENCEVSPIEFKKATDKLSIKFIGYRQNDSQELLCFIIDKIHDETKSDVYIELELNDKIIKYKKNIDKLNKNIKKNPSNVSQLITQLDKYKSNNTKNELILESINYWKKVLKDNYSVIIDIFQHLDLTTIKCKECNMYSYKFDHCNFFELSIPEYSKNNISIEDLLKFYIESEDLTGDNKYQCSKCNKKTDAEKYTHIWHQPEIMILFIKKYHNHIYKNNTKVEYDHTINMKPYVSKYWKNGNIYELYATIYHSGGLHGGHYMAYVKNPIDKNWYLCNDSNISRVDFNDVLKSNSYLLFYRKK